MHNYLHALAAGWPTRLVHSSDNGATYAGLIADDELPLPDQAELETFMHSQAQAAKWEIIKREREMRRQAGVNVGGYWFHSDDTSRIQVIGLVMMGQSMPIGLMWKTMPNTFIEMTPTLAMQVFQQIGNVDGQIFAICEQHRQQMLASADPDAYDHLNTAPAWPQTFEESQQ